MEQSLQNLHTRYKILKEKYFVDDNFLILVIFSKKIAFLEGKSNFLQGFKYQLQIIASLQNLAYNGVVVVSAPEEKVVSAPEFGGAETINRLGPCQN